MKQGNGMKRWAVLFIALQLALMTRPAAASDEVKIGVMTDMNGPDSDLGGLGSVIAAQMAIEDFGQTAAGRKIVLLSGDHQRKPDVAAALAMKWYDNEAVDIIVDIPLSSAALAVQDIARQRKKIVIFSVAGSSDLTGKSCSPTGFHWTYDTKAVANGTAAAITKAGGKTWFFLTSDYAFGHALQRDAETVVKANGGTVVGSVRHPVSSLDFSSFLLQAKNSKAQVIGLANSVNDTANSIRQANEFAVQADGQNVAALLAFITDINALGLKIAKGTRLTESFYWDLNNQTRAWSERFSKRHNGRKPTSPQAGVYSAVLHYLKAVAAANSTDGPTVAAKMRELPVNDFMTNNAKVWPSGWVARDFYLFEVKSPEESKGPWDYYKLLSTIPAAVAHPPNADDECPLMKSGG